MPRYLRPLLLLTVLVAIIPHHTAVAHGCGDIAALAAPAGDEPVERWRYVDPEAGHYQITGVADGAIFVGSSTPGCAYGFTAFAALDAATGAPVWELRGDDLGGGVSSTIEQYGDRILFPIYTDDAPALIAIDAATGDAAWTITGETETPDPAGLSGDLLLTLESGLDRSILAAVALETGEPVWSVALDGYSRDLFVTGSALIAAVRTGDANAFHYETLAFDPATGDELWSLPVADVATSVLAAAGDLAYAVVGDPFLAAEALVGLDPATGDEAWRTEFDPEDLWLLAGVVADGLLLRGGLAESVSLALLDPESGEPVWTLKEIDGPGVPNAVVQHTDDIAVIEWLDEAEGVVTLTEINLASGDELWTADPLPVGLGHFVTVSGETEQAYVAVDYGESAAISALDFVDGSLAWDAAYPDLGGPQVLRVTEETIYLLASSPDETVLIALQPPPSS